MVSGIEDVFFGDMLSCQKVVTLAESSATGVGLISALDVAVRDFHLVSDELANAHFSVRESGALDTVLVLFAHGVKCVDWGTVTGVGHWSVTEDKTVAAVGPVLALVELWVVVFHHVGKLEVSFFILETFFSDISGEAGCLSGDNCNCK